MTATVTRSNAAPGIDIVTLNRPDRLNALNHELISDLHTVLDELRLDRTVRVVVLTGAGRGFCAGLDIQSGAAVPGTEHLNRVRAGMATQQHIASLIPKLRSLPQPVIAAVNGPAAGGGLALSLGCDVRIAAQSAKFNVAFVRLGVSGCDIGVSWLLPRLIGASAAFELMLTGELIDADEAYRLKLVSRVVPDGEAVESALETAQKIVANSPTGVWMTKEVMWSQLEIGSLQAGIDIENRTQIMCSTTGELAEAMRAFVEKRPAVFGD